MKINIMDFETGEWLGTVTTRYYNIETLLGNVQRWMRRHPEYRHVTAEELETVGIMWSTDAYWVMKA